MVNLSLLHCCKTTFCSEEPTQVTNVKIDTVTDTTVTVTWDPVAAINDYKVNTLFSTRLLSPQSEILTKN